MARTPKEPKPAKAAKAAEGEKAKRKKPIKPIIMVLVLLLVGKVVMGKVVKPHYRPGAKVPAGVIVPLGSITTNLADGHLAQVAISMQMTVAASSKQVDKLTPELIGSTVSVLGGDTYAELLPATGRAALRRDLLRIFQHELGPNEGAQQVSAVYFTSFVLQ